MSQPISTGTIRGFVESPKGAAIVMVVWLALLWLIELVDQLLGHALDLLGIQSWNIASLPSIFIAPFLHDGWPHLAQNSMPFLVLGFFVALTGLFRWLISSVSAIIGSGALAWLLSPPNSITIGASGLIFGWLTFLLARGIFSRNARQIVIAIIVFLAYGSILWGLLPTASAVSWQGHLGGAIGGILAAWLTDRRDDRLRAR